MGFYLHFIDDRPVEHAPIEHLIDRDGFVFTVTTVCIVLAAVAQLWQWGVLQALGSAFFGG